MMSPPFEFIFQIMIVSVGASFKPVSINYLQDIFPCLKFFFPLKNTFEFPPFHSNFSLALLGCHLGTQWRHRFPLSHKISCEPTNQQHKITAFSYWLASGVPGDFLEVQASVFWFLESRGLKLSGKYGDCISKLSLGQLTLHFF